MSQFSLGPCSYVVYQSQVLGHGRWSPASECVTYHVPVFSAITGNVGALLVHDKCYQKWGL